MSEDILLNEVLAPTGDVLPDVGDVVLYPDDEHDGRGIYPVTAAALADELEADGLSVRTVHDDDWVEYYGDREPIVLGIIVGIVSAAAWDGIKRLLARRKGSRVNVTLGYRQSGEVKWIRAEGDAADVAVALGKLA